MNRCPHPLPDDIKPKKVEIVKEIAEKSEPKVGEA